MTNSFGEIFNNLKKIGQAATDLNIATFWQ
jgi:hypothetical protein